MLERTRELVRCAGIDRQTIADIEQHTGAKLLDELAADLKDGSYRPLPARRVFIPKPGWSDEHRPLSIPPVHDRVVQSAVRPVIEPIFEADFLPCSLGFRPRRSAHDGLHGAEHSTPERAATDWSASTEPSLRHDLTGRGVREPNADGEERR